MVMVGDGVGIGVGSHQSSGVGKGAGSHHWSDVDECCLTGVFGVFVLAVAVTAGGCCILQPMKRFLLLSFSIFVPALSTAIDPCECSISNSLTFAHCHADSRVRRLEIVD